MLGYFEFSHEVKNSYRTKISTRHKAHLWRDITMFHSRSNVPSWVVLRYICKNLTNEMVERLDRIRLSIEPLIPMCGILTSFIKT